MRLERQPKVFFNPNQASVHAPTRRLGRREQGVEIDQQQLEVDQLHSMLYRLLNQGIEDIGHNAKHRQLRQLEIYQQQQQQAQTQLKPSVKHTHSQPRPLNLHHPKPYGYIALSQVLRNRARELHKIVMGYKSLPTTTTATDTPSSSSKESSVAHSPTLPQKHSVSVPIGLLTYEQTRLEFLLEASRQRFLLELNMVLSTLKQSHNPFSDEYEYGYKWFTDDLVLLDFAKKQLEVVGPGPTQGEEEEEGENENKTDTIISVYDLQIRREVEVLPTNIPLHPKFLAISSSMNCLLSFIRNEAIRAGDGLSFRLADAYCTAPHYLMIAWALDEASRLDHGATNTQRYLWLQERRKACLQVWSEIKSQDLIEQDDPMYKWWQNVTDKWERSC